MLCLEHSLNVNEIEFRIFFCAKMIINSGIRKIYYLEEYPDPLAIELLNEAKVELVKLNF